MGAKNTPAETEQRHKLFESGWIQVEPPESAPVEVRREMTIFGGDGVEMGRVAAVVADCHTHQPTHILLCHVQPGFEYRLVALTLIEHVHDGVIRLNIPGQAIAELPLRAMP